MPTALHAGICVRQQSVSIKDAIIAREALSLLVTCLQLRCQQLCKSQAGVKSHHKDTLPALMLIHVMFFLYLLYIAIDLVQSVIVLQYVHFL